MVLDHFVLRLCKQFNRLKRVKRRHLNRFKSIQDAGKVLNVLLTSEDLLLTKSNHAKTFRNRKTLSFSFLTPLLHFPISCSSFSYSPVEVPSQEYSIFPVFLHCVFDTSSCCLHLFTLYCHYFPPFIVYMNFSFHASFFSLFWSLFFNPQFHPSYNSPGKSSLFIFSFCP
jgi:hypothetical protein